jgi:hypothetical protein
MTETITKLEQKDLINLTDEVLNELEEKAWEKVKEAREALNAAQDFWSPFNKEKVIRKLLIERTNAKANS